MVSLLGIANTSPARIAKSICLFDCQKSQALRELKNVFEHNLEVYWPKCEGRVITLLSLYFWNLFIHKYFATEKMLT